MENVAAMIGETGIVHREGRKVRRNVHFTGEFSVAGVGSQLRKRTV